MSQQTVIEAQPKASEQQVQKLVRRVSQLEAELAQVKAEMQWVLTNLPKPAKMTNGWRAPTSPSPDAVAWKPPTPEELAYLQTISDDELVPIHYMTDEDVRDYLDEFEQKYGLSSEEFYAQWKRGDADDIMEKTGWVIMYESWLRILEHDQKTVEVFE